MKLQRSLCEILFRGKRLDNNEWIEGDLVHSVYKVGDTCIGKYGFTIGMHQVDPSTVGQYTGLTDKNGKRIFEGDILECVSDLVSLSGKKTGGSAVDREVVEWGEYGWVVKKIHSSRWTSTWNAYGMKCNLYKAAATKYACVIGNIHDNPELLEG